MADMETDQIRDPCAELSIPSGIVEVAIVSQSDEVLSTVSVAHNAKWLEIPPTLQALGFTLDNHVGNSILEKKCNFMIFCLCVAPIILRP